MSYKPYVGRVRCLIKRKGKGIMASYVPVPRDLTRVKTRIIFHLTKRQILCFGLAALIGVPSFLLLKQAGNISMASMGMILIIMPLFLLAMYEQDGQTLEVKAKHFVESTFFRTKIRPYRTDNYYSLLMKAVEAERKGNDNGTVSGKGRRREKRMPKGKDRKRENAGERRLYGESKKGAARKERETRTVGTAVDSV